MLNKVLRLERPLAVIDCETTGLNPEIDRIVQLAITIHYPHRDSIAWSTYVNPGIPIKNTENHHITDEDVKDAPPFSAFASSLAPKITNVDICGYNVDFDIKFVQFEMARAGVIWKWEGHIIDPLHIYRFKKGHTLENCYKEYVDPSGFKGAHNAPVDVAATEAALIGQLNFHQDLPRTVRDLSAFCFPHPENAVDKNGKFVWVGDDAGFNFGKFRGRLLKDPEVKNYLSWVASKGDFSSEVKEIAINALQGIYPTKS